MISGGERDGLSKAEFDAFAGDYEGALNEGLKFTGESKDYFAQQRIAWMVGRLKGDADEVQTVLDFGCGTGTGRRFLNEAFPGSVYWGFDPSAESILVAKVGAEASGAQFTSDESGLPAGGFDLAFTNGVFHHIPPDQRAAAFRLVWQALKPGGWFAFWENNRWNPMVHFIMSRVPFDKEAQMLFPHEARRLLANAGFEGQLTDYLFVFPAALRALRWLEPVLCKVPFGGQYLILARKPF